MFTGNWREVDAAEVGRPHPVRANPVFTYEVSGPGLASQGLLTQGGVPGVPTDAAGNPMTGGLTFLECVYDELYDTFQIAVATLVPVINLFNIQVGAQSTVIGGSSFNKTLQHTNLTGQGGILPNPQRFMCKTVTLDVLPEIYFNDIRNLFGTSIVTFQIGDRQLPYLQLLANRIPSGPSIKGGAIGTPTGYGTTGSGWLTNGWEDTRNVLHLSAGVDVITGQMDEGVAINQGQNFQVLIDGTQNATKNVLGTAGTSWTTTAGSTTGGTGVTGKVSFPGTRARSV